jgi:HEAT repeat protein
MRRLILSGMTFVLGLSLPSALFGQTASFLGEPMTKWQVDLQSPQAKVRRSAAFALGKIGVEARPAWRNLLLRLREDKDVGVREATARAIGEIVRDLQGGGPLMWAEAKPALLKAVADTNGHLRGSAVFAIGCFGGEAKDTNARSALQEALKDPEANVRQNAAWALGQVGPEAAAAVGSLCELLNDKDALVRRDAAGALGALGPAASKSVQPLMSMLGGEPDEVVRKTALDSLGHLVGPEHRDLAEKMDPLLKDADIEVAFKAALVLGRIGGHKAANALPVLRRALKDPDPHMQELATAALANIGPAAAPAVEDLAAVLIESPETIVRRNAALALGHLGEGVTKPAVPALALAIKAKEPVEVRQYAAEALAQIRYPTNEAALPAILDAIEKDDDPLVRQRCVWSLFGLRDLPRVGADKVLAKLLDETDERTSLVRYDAARALANALADKAPAKTPEVLLHMLQNKQLRVFNGTDARVEGAGNEAQSGKSNVMESIGGDARYMAVEALGWLGDLSRKRPEVMKALREAAKDSDPKLRSTAKQAFKDLGVNE